MSKIIRQTVAAPSVYIGEKHLDFEKEAYAEKRLSRIFPVVSVLTDSDGAKLIPISEVVKIEETLVGEVAKARKEGYDAGHQAGLHKGLEEAQKVLSQFDKAIKDTVGQREALLDEARGAVLDLIIAISRKVTFDAIEIDPELTLKMIEGVIDTLVDRSRLKIKVNPSHLPVVEQGIDRFLKNSTAIKEITIEPDPRVQHGGCFIETPTGDIDARVESQFEVIRETLLADEVES